MRLIAFPFSAIQNVLPFIGNGIETKWIYYATVDIQEFISYKGHWPDFIINKVCVPNRALDKKYGQVIDPFIHKMNHIENEKSTLNDLRDSLLPKLLSGQIRLKQAEKIISEAV